MSDNIESTETAAPEYPVAQGDVVRLNNGPTGVLTVFAPEIDRFTFDYDLATGGTDTVSGHISNTQFELVSPANPVAAADEPVDTKKK